MGIGVRRVLFILASALTAWALATALAHAAKVYRDSLEGIQTASSEGGSVNLLLNATGDLPGMYNVALRRDANNVTGGSWTMTVFPPDADATSGEKGRLMGAVTGGALTFNGDGALTAADSVQLTIQSGAGQYAGVKSGSGSISLSSRAENPSQLTGALTLNF